MPGFGSLDKRNTRAKVVKSFVRVLEGVAVVLLVDGVYEMFSALPL